MSNIIESAYEIIEQIGVGGGGKVYLAKHKRLNKDVVLKFDKRKITTNPEILRREVDVLKNLHHSYIPQVYDFIVEDDQIITVMDYIKGESLDRPLKRGEVYPQAQVITWAKELLEALVYLHSPTHGDPPKGYVHSDIKPANIMRLPNNDICLIDYNISLAIGEYNFIGRSIGYSSPEHYGIDYSDKKSIKKDTKSESATTVMMDSENNESAQSTILMGQDETIKMSEPPLSTGSSSTGTKKIMPDVRSDIYSLGATLYHLLSGTRPEKDAMNVIPLSTERFSKPVVDIISKAMKPNPDERYQSAEEMLNAFEMLRSIDPRTLRLKRSKRISIGVSGVMLLVGLSVTFLGMKRIANFKSALINAEYSQNSLAEGDVKQALSYALDGLPTINALFNPEYLAEPQKALTSALGVYDLSDSYKSVAAIQLPSAPFFVRLSEDGKTGACICSKKLEVFSTESGSVIAELDADRSALSEVEFIDNERLVFAGAEGLTCYDCSSKSVLWTSAPATAIAVSGDKKKVIGVYKDESVATIYDSQTGEKVGDELNFAPYHQYVDDDDSAFNPDRNLLDLNEDGSVFVISFSDGTVMYINYLTGEPQIIMDESEYNFFSGGFIGNDLAVCGSAGKDSKVIAVDYAASKILLESNDFKESGAVNLKIYNDTVYMKQNKVICTLDLITKEIKTCVSCENTINAYDVEDNHIIVSTENTIEIYSIGGEKIAEFEGYSGRNLCSLRNGYAVFGNRDSKELRILRFEQDKEGTLADYPLGFDHRYTKICADGKHIMQFTINQFRILDLDGNVLCEKEIHDSQKVFDLQFRRNEKGSYLEVTYSDGKVVCYDSETGEITEENTIEKPPSADEKITVFTSENYRFESPLHGDIQVYDVNSGKLVKKIEKDGYFKDIWFYGDLTIMQLFNNDNGKNTMYYGLILDKDLNEIAYIPHLADFLNGELIMDYPTGTIKKSKIYSIEELIDKGKMKLEELK